MLKYLLTAAATVALSSPGLARDGQPYVGLEGGYIVKADTDFDIDVQGVEFDDSVELNYKSGYDVDAILGYDFGALRAEAEIGHKRLKVSGIEASPALLTGLGGNVDLNEIGDRVSVLSGMLNLLFDIGDGPGVNFYAGGGAGVARVKAFDEKGTVFAWQAIAGLRAPVSENIDVGLKYRYFNASADLDVDEGPGFNVDGDISSHSILASLIFNFGSPARVAEPAYVPPPPVAAPLPAPPPVATQTCYDGSVVPVTSNCPLPPPPPVRSGERG